MENVFTELLPNHGKSQLLGMKSRKRKKRKGNEGGRGKKSKTGWARR